MLEFPAVAPPRDSALVRVSVPKLSDRSARCPSSFIRWRRRWVSSTPAANTTCPAVRVSRGRRPDPERHVSTAYPPPGRGRTALTVVIGAIVAPVSYTHLRAHETVLDLVCRLLL